MDLQKPKIIFYDKDKKLLFKSNWEFAGSFYKESGLWVWSWADPNTSKNETYIATKLLRYGCDINNDSSNDKFLKMILTNSRFKIENQSIIRYHWIYSIIFI